ncbi:hypothetical protein BGW80DRAFT_1312534 [Lactifluus volemus]|jgi:hypothetical protein|nr:hypothetical protein BGW80DRAFT_1312534 [Lactifluus volemus]
MGSYQVPYNQPPSYVHHYDPPPRLPPTGVVHPAPGGAAPYPSCAPVNAPRPYPNVGVHPNPQRPQLSGSNFAPQPSGGYTLQQPPNMSQIALRPDYVCKVLL